jgi:putative endonuclease
MTMDQTMDRQQRGIAAEERAARHMQQAGFEILVRNFRCRLGELDIVAQRHDLLVVAEVRLRTHADFGGAAGSVTARKRMRIVRTARYLLLGKPALRQLKIRFDALLLSTPEGPIDWIEDAFN